MAKITLIFAALLIFLGMVAFVGTGVTHRAAFVPAEIGMVLLICGWMATSPDASRRKQFMHISVTIGLVAFVGGAVQAAHSYLHASTAGHQPDRVVLFSTLSMSVLMLVYTALCVRSFVAARRTGKI